MAIKKIAPHFQLGLSGGWLVDFYDKSGCQWGKLMDPGHATPFPERPAINWIIRFNEDEATARDEVLKGETGAWDRIERVKSELLKRPWLKKPTYYLEHMNEPTNAGILSTKAGRLALDEFTAVYTEILWMEYGIRSVGYCLGVGHPEREHVAQLFTRGFPALYRCEGMWSTHDYGWPEMQDAWPVDKEGWPSDSGYHCLRYRMVVGEARKLNLPIPPLAITECGIDKLLIGEVGGWQKVNNSGEWYVDSQLAWFDGELQKDPYVVVATPFTCSAEKTWKSYEMREGDMEILASRMSGG